IFSACPICGVVHNIRLTGKYLTPRAAQPAAAPKQSSAPTSLRPAGCYNFGLPAEIRHSVCALDCPDACALLINVEDGKGSRLRGDPGHPVTRGFLCGKVARYLEREYSPERLLYPMRRVGSKGEGRFTRIAWDEAIDEIAVRFQAISAESGPEAILPYSYGGSMGYLQGSGMDRRFFHRLGPSPLDRPLSSPAARAPPPPSPRLARPPP